MTDEAVMTYRDERIDDYIRKCPETIMPLLEDLRVTIHESLPGASEGMQYGVPTFLNAHGVPVIYLFGAKKGHVNFGFLRSPDISDPHGILQAQQTPAPPPGSAI